MFSTIKSANEETRQSHSGCNNVQLPRFLFGQFVKAAGNGVTGNRTTEHVQNDERRQRLSLLDLVSTI